MFLFIYLFFTQRALYKQSNVVALSAGKIFGLNLPIKIAARYVYVNSFKSKCCFAFCDKKGLKFCHSLS